MRFHHSIIFVLFIANFLFGQVREPVITPEGGLFSSSRLVIINSGINDSNSAIYYTIDNSNPLLSQTRILYRKPFRITKSCIVKAVSINREGFKSDLASVEFKKITKLESPNIQQLTNSKSYAIFSEQKLRKEGIELYYTTDGRDPSIFGHLYKGEIFSKHGTHIQAVALHNKREYLNSDIVSVVIDTTVHKKDSRDLVQELFFKKKMPSVKDTSSLKIHWRNGESAGDFLISFSHGRSDMNFIYTLDGSDPMPGSTMWTGKEINVKSPAHIKVRTYEIGMKLGSIKEKVFNPPQLLEPVSNVPSGTPFSGELKVHLSVPGETMGIVEILYTTNGKDPLIEGELYNGPIILNENSVIRALAQRAGFSTSNEARFEYFHMIEVTSALFLDNNKDGFIESARLTLSSLATNEPPKMIFTDPSNMEEIVVLDRNIQFGESRDILLISFDKPLNCSPDFEPGHFGAVAVAGEYSTTPFLVYGEKSTLALESEQTLNIQISNNPFIPDVSVIPESLQELSDFSITNGTAISIRPKKPSFGYISIFDALGNVILSKREMIEDGSGALYLLWNGKNNNKKKVACGNYLIIISTEEKVNGTSAQGRGFVSVKCP